VPFVANDRAEVTKLLVERQGQVQPDGVAVRTIARARVWFEQLTDGKAQSIAEIAAREGITAAGPEASSKACRDRPCHKEPEAPRVLLRLQSQVTCRASIAISLAAVDLSTNVPSTSAAVEMTLAARDQPQFSRQPIMTGVEMTPPTQERSRSQ
jgi:hypothetical protein